MGRFGRIVEDIGGSGENKKGEGKKCVKEMIIDVRVEGINREDNSLHKGKKG